MIQQGFSLNIIIYTFKNNFVVLFVTFLNLDTCILWTYCTNLFEFFTLSGSTVPATADNSSSSSGTGNTGVIKTKLDLGSNPVTKLQLLQERRNKLSTEHHPSFANHFGFAGRYRPDHGPLLLNFNNRNNTQNNTHARAARTMAHPIEKSANNSSSAVVPNNKMAVTKSKSSTIEYSKDRSTYR